MKAEEWAQSRQRTGIVVSRGGLGGGCFIFYLLYCSEYLVGYLRHNRIAEGFYGFCSPLRKGDISQSAGNPIISSTNNGLSCGEPCPSEGGQFAIIFDTSSVRFRFPQSLFTFPFASCAFGVGSSPILAASAIVGRSLAFGEGDLLMRPLPLSIEVGVGSSPACTAFCNAFPRMYCCPFPGG